LIPAIGYKITNSPRQPGQDQPAYVRKGYFKIVDLVETYKEMSSNIEGQKVIARLKANVIGAVGRGQLVEIGENQYRIESCQEMIGLKQIYLGEL
jgi:hypothetical protein